MLGGRIDCENKTGVVDVPPVEGSERKLFNSDTVLRQATIMVGMPTEIDPRLEGLVDESRRFLRNRIPLLAVFVFVYRVGV